MNDETKMKCSLIFAQCCIYRYKSFSSFLCACRLVEERQQIKDAENQLVLFRKVIT